MPDDSLLDISTTIENAVAPEMTESIHKHRSLEGLEGEIISGRYQIIRRIGRGGMGVVYVAQQTNLNRDVCIKVLNPALIDDADAVARFEREAKGLSRLQHPNIVTIFDYGRDDDLTYIVMEYAQGITLNKYLKANAPLSIDIFLPIAVQILKGIGEAHKMGLIHRDIKPANIILSELEGEQNFVKILDFGLAKLVQGQDELTKEQQLVGSASYMSPEQITNGHSDTRTDVYSLGVMFYLMLSGQKPFTGTDNAVLYQHVNELPKLLHSCIDESQNIPETLCEVIDQCLNKDPDKRPQTATDLLTAISYALDAPQLRAGYSSMTMTAVDPQKPSNNELSPHLNLDDISEITETSAPSSPSSVSAPSLPVREAVSTYKHTDADLISTSDNPSVSLHYVSQMSPRQIRDRRVLLILLVGITTAVAILAGIIVNYLTGNPSSSERELISTNNATLITASDFQALDEYIKKNDFSEAENFIKNLEKKSNANTTENNSRLSEYKAVIANGKLLQIAQNAMKSKDCQTAQKTYQDILINDPDYKKAQTGKIEAEICILMNEAAAEEKKYNYDKAIDIYNKIINIKNNDINKDNQTLAKNYKIKLENYPKAVFPCNIGDKPCDATDRKGINLYNSNNELISGSLAEQITLEPGNYIIRVEKEGFEPWESEYELKETLLPSGVPTEGVSIILKPKKKPKESSSGGGSNSGSGTNILGGKMHTTPRGGRRR